MGIKGHQGPFVKCESLQNIFPGSVSFKNEIVQGLWAISFYTHTQKSFILAVTSLHGFSFPSSSSYN